MIEIQNFFIKIFLLEQETNEALRYPDVDIFNTKFSELTSYSLYQEIGFGMAKLDKPMASYKYRILQRGPKSIPRHIYKISKYKHLQYGNVFIGFVSPKKPLSNILSYGNCYLVAEIDSELKIIARYTFGDSDLLKSQWKFTGGDRTLTFDNLGKPIEILRLLEPKDDEDSLADYAKEK